MQLGRYGTTGTKTPQEEKAEDLIYESTYINKILERYNCKLINFHDLTLPEESVWKRRLL